MHRAGAARPPAVNAFHHECRPLEIDPTTRPLFSRSIAVRIVLRSARSRSAGNASIARKRNPRAGKRKNSAIVIQSIFRRDCQGNEKRIEMTDMICCQQKSAGGIRVFTSNHANTCDAAKQHFHQQRSNAIGNGVKRGMNDE